MSTHQCMNRLCCVAIVVALLLTGVMVYGKQLGIQATDNTMGYESRLFDTAKVHTIDIEMDNWESFIASCEDEAYVNCTVVIDGEAKKNVAIRAKGNTSLQNVSQLGSQRYSFKLEFDHYETGKSYYGLDKLSLNNLIQDNTMMKDYLSYQLMNAFGVAAPLCSYTYVTVNGADWGLYLAVEGVEDAFLERNYGSEGELYKPDSLQMGGGRGNGREFDMDALTADDTDATASTEETQSAGGRQRPEGMERPNGMQRPEGMERPDGMEMPEGMEQPGGMGMGSSDVKLQYIDDDPDSYSNIFGNAKTDVTTADQKRLISSLKTLSETENAASVVDTDAVLRYFVVHDFVCNGDSYTGSMIHNYYLYENGGVLSMIPWDYNLAFGGFQSSSATATVNSPIDSPVTGDADDRPMASWFLDDGEYQAQYHELYARFIEETDFAALVDETAALISPYVESDPTKFCTTEEFTTAAETLREFCLLREQSIEGQLNGTIPATSEEQAADSAALIDAAAITISDMGSMQAGGMGRGFQPTAGKTESSENAQNTTAGQDGSFTPPDGQTGDFTPPDGQTGDFTPPDGQTGFAGTAAGAAISTETWLLLGVCVLVLLFGILLAVIYRRRTK